MTKRILMVLMVQLALLAPQAAQAEKVTVLFKIPAELKELHPEAAESQLTCYLRGKGTKSQLFNSPAKSDKNFTGFFEFTVTVEDEWLAKQDEWGCFLYITKTGSTSPNAALESDRTDCRKRSEEYRCARKGTKPVIALKGKLDLN